MVDTAPLNITHAISRALGLRALRPPPSSHTATNEERLLDITGKSHDILFNAKTVFPFDLFPDSITMDREKLTITQRFFFFTARIISVPVRDILSVEASVGPFFGSIHLTSRYFATNPYSVDFLHRRDALILQKLLQGYVIAYERDVDCSEIDRTELISLLYSLGQGEL